MVKKVVIVLAAAAVAVLLLRYFFPSDERLIRRQFDRLTENISRPAGEKALAGLQRAAAVSDLFSDRVRLDLPEAGLAGEYDRQEIRTLAMVFRNRFTRLSVECRDLHMTLDRDQARITATCRARGVAGSEQVRETREVRAELVRTSEDGWLFSGCAFVQVLRR